MSSSVGGSPFGKSTTGLEELAGVELAEDELAEVMRPIQHEPSRIAARPPN
jgi:hypothetical protein